MKNFITDICFIIFHVFLINCQLSTRQSKAVDHLMLEEAELEQ